MVDLPKSHFVCRFLPKALFYDERVNMLLYVMDNYNSCFLKSIGQGCLEVGPGYSIMTNLHLLFDLHLIRCLYLFPSMWVVLLLLELCCSSKAGTQWCRTQTTSPKSWPWLIPFSGPDASSRGIVKASSNQILTLSLQFLLRNRYNELECLFHPLVNYRNIL